MPYALTIASVCGMVPGPENPKKIKQRDRLCRKDLCVQATAGLTYLQALCSVWVQQFAQVCLQWFHEHLQVMVTISLVHMSLCSF